MARHRATSLDDTSIDIANAQCGKRSLRAARSLSDLKNPGIRRQEASPQHASVLPRVKPQTLQDIIKPPPPKPSSRPLSYISVATTSSASSNPARSATPTTPTRSSETHTPATSISSSPQVPSPANATRTRGSTLGHRARMLQAELDPSILLQQQQQQQQQQSAAESSLHHPKCILPGLQHASLGLESLNKLHTRTANNKPAWWCARDRLVVLDRLEYNPPPLRSPTLDPPPSFALPAGAARGASCRSSFADSSLCIKTSSAKGTAASRKNGRREKLVMQIECEHCRELLGLPGKEWIFGVIVEERRVCRDCRVQAVREGLCAGSGMMGVEWGV